MPIRKYKPLKPCKASVEESILQIGKRKSWYEPRLLVMMTFEYLTGTTNVQWKIPYINRKAIKTLNRFVTYHQIFL